jgi:hypothetical protein
MTNSSALSVRVAFPCHGLSLENGFSSGCASRHGTAAVTTVPEVACGTQETGAQDAGTQEPATQ